MLGSLDLPRQQDLGVNTISLIKPFILEHGACGQGDPCGIRSADMANGLLGHVLRLMSIYINESVNTQ